VLRKRLQPATQPVLQRMPSVRKSCPSHPPTAMFGPGHQRALLLLCRGIL